VCIITCKRGVSRLLQSAASHKEKALKKAKESENLTFASPCIIVRFK